MLQVVFGSCVVLNPSDDTEDRAIVLHDECNVLDHACLMPGVTVGRGAVTGTYTIGPKGHTFDEFSISTGNKDGEPILLKYQGSIDDGTSKLPEADQAKVRAAREMLRDFNNFVRFNLFYMCVVVLVEPMPQAVESFSALAGIWAWEAGSGMMMAVIIACIVYIALNIAMVGVVVLAKRWIVGTFIAGDYPFFEYYHHAWITMMAISDTISNTIEALQGTKFVEYYCRAMGATIGKDCCMFFGCGLEFDLLELGDFVSIGDECDITCHTVENMVIKLATVKLGNHATMSVESVVMPGASMEAGAVLCPNSQVLKGETVEPAEVSHSACV